MKNKFPPAISKILNYRYQVSGSAGISQWAKVPWFAIFDKDISVSAQGGYDVVYLFSQDMQGVYLSVNQGYTYYRQTFKKPNMAIRGVTDYWKNKIGNLPDRFSFDEIFLCSQKNKTTSSGLPRGYAKGNICSIYYSIDNLPQEDELLNDLYNALSILSEIKSKLIGLNYKHTNKFILSQTESAIEQKVTKDEKQFENELNFQKYKFQETVPPTSSITIQPRKRRAHKSDYTKRNEKNKKLGYAGECAIVEYEKNKLLNSSESKIRELADKIIHSSVEEGDGLGYDIQSFDTEGNIIYIEVKTTLKEIDTPFYITYNELNASKELHNYCLYRLYDVDIANEKIKFYTLKGPLDKLVTLHCVNYLASPK